jgi:aerobic carbon-monoxide dehydrogenase small subunit
MPRVTIAMNGPTRSARVENRTLLVRFLPDHLRLTGTPVGCDTSQCRRMYRAHRWRRGKILYSACRCLQWFSGHHQGLQDGGNLHPMQQSFHENHGLRCGFYTPGMITSAVDIVRRSGYDQRTVRNRLTAIFAAAPATTILCLQSWQTRRRCVRVTDDA